MGKRDQATGNGFRLAVLDLDGTLLNDDRQVSDQNRAAIARAAAAGISFALATGRPFPSARPYALALGIDLPLVCYNGALVRDARGAAPRFHRPIAPPAAAQTVRLLEHRGLHPTAYIDDVLCVSHVTEETRWLCEAYSLEYRAVGNLAGFLGGTPGEPGTAPTMIVAHPAPDETARLVEELERELGRHPGGGITCHRPNDYALNIVRSGASKEEALRRLAAELAVDRSEVLAIGNADNDVDMLRWAGCGVAVGNATAAALAVADWVSVDNNNNGVAVALERFLF